jgi:hypothetical protein
MTMIKKAYKGLSTPGHRIKNHIALKMSDFFGMTLETRVPLALSAGVISLVAIMSASPALAQGVDPKIHNLCKDAKDYAGCVRAMTTDVTAPVPARIDQTVRPGLLSEVGNQCPAGYGYVGGGRCRSVVCKGMSIFGRNQRELAGKGHRCGGGSEALNQGILFGRGTLTWGNDYTNASFNPNCPSREMNIGDLSTCSLGGSFTAQ